MTEAEGRSHSPLTEPPIRLCCMTRHYGVECPDGTFMCCLCFGKFPVADAFVAVDGDRIDACQACGPQTEAPRV